MIQILIHRSWNLLIHFTSLISTVQHKKSWRDAEPAAFYFLFKDDVYIKTLSLNEQPTSDITAKS